MADYKLTGLFVWRRCVTLGYPALESFLSAEPMLDEALICADYGDDFEMRLLCERLAQRFDGKVRIAEFPWPIGKVPGDGSAIGVASQYALEQVRTSHVVNIQCDEIWPVTLMEWMRDNIRDGMAKGLECMRFKVLNTEHNAQRFQGGEQWDGQRRGTDGDYTDVWKRGGMFNGSDKGGAGYNMAVKLAKVCPDIRFKHDAWEFGGCPSLHHSALSDEWPIIHLHDFFRDHYKGLRHNAGYTLWTDAQYGNYKADADRIEATESEWSSDPIWTATKSPFDELLPDFVRPLIGQTSYKIRWELLR